MIDKVEYNLLETMKSLADEDLRPLVKMVCEDRGIDLSKYKDKYLRRRIGVRLRASGAYSLKHYMKIMRQNTHEYQHFIDTLTINTSNFFRNKDCFDIISQTLLPSVASMVKEHTYRPPFIWSVGCARGEEAYSLALLIVKYPSLWSESSKPPILATDIDAAALEQARRGVYGNRAVSKLIGTPLENLLRREGNTYSVLEKIKKMVTFYRHDILKDDLGGRYLLVMCRNLLIYLEKEAQEKLMGRLAQSLNPGGYLVLGKSEILIGEAREKFEPVSAKERIYKKLSTHTSVTASDSGVRRKG